MTNEESNILDFHLRRLMNASEAMLECLRKMTTSEFALGGDREARNAVADALEGANKAYNPTEE